MIEIDYSLGGFAEFKEDIDGTEEEFEIFNRCLASDYYRAFYNEDYEALGVISGTLIDEIALWYTNDDESDVKDFIEIKKGLIKTKNNRTFIDAIVEDKRGDYADVFISNGNLDVRLFITVILYGDFNKVLCSLWLPFLDKEQYFNLLENVFLELEKIYLSLESEEEKMYLLSKVKNTIENTKYNPEFGKYTLPSDNKVIKALKNQNK